MNVGLRVQSTALSQLYRAAAEYQSGSSTTAFKQQKVLRRSRQLAKSSALANHLLCNMQHRNTGQHADKSTNLYGICTHESTGLLVTIRNQTVTNSAL